jgi:carbonic anhydrase/acetyltransferase-like protein (isoleucine patch superfamily)
LAIYQLEEHRPKVHATAWVAESAQVIGRVELGEGCSVWYGAVLRGDNDIIQLGPRCNVQDGAVLHTDKGWPLTLAADVSIGHQAMVHGCTVGEGTLIGIQAIVLNGAKIGAGCLVGAGAVVTEGKEFPPGSLILGSPAKAVKDVTPEQMARLRHIASHYVAQAARHRSGLKRMDSPA